MTRHRLVQMRRGMRVPVMVGLSIGVAIFFLAMVGRVAATGLDDSGNRQAAIFVAILFAFLAALLWYGRPRDGAVWDLDQRVITSKGEQIPFSAITRVIVHTGLRGYYGLTFVGTHGHLPRLSIPIWSATSPDPLLWNAIRELVASPHAPMLEGYGVLQPSARSLGKPPIAATNGALAVRTLDSQVAWVAHGGDQRSPDSPVEQFRLSRHHGP